MQSIITDHVKKSIPQLSQYHSQIVEKIRQLFFGSDKSFLEIDDYYETVSHGVREHSKDNINFIHCYYNNDYNKDNTSNIDESMLFTMMGFVPDNTIITDSTYTYCFKHLSYDICLLTMMTITYNVETDELVFHVASDLV